MLLLLLGDAIHVGTWRHHQVDGYVIKKGSCVCMLICCIALLIREEFNKLCDDLLERITAPLQDALKKSGSVYCSLSMHALIY